MTANTLSLQVRDLAGFVNAGFDSVSLTGSTDLDLSGSGTVTFGRTLILNAGKITDNDTGKDQIVLVAPWVQLMGGNPSNFWACRRKTTRSALSAKAPGGTGRLDVTDGAFFSGFQKVTLEAAQDMTFSQTSTSTVPGFLATAGDLTLQAARIYPTTQQTSATNNTASDPNGGIAAGGKVTILLRSASEPDGLFRGWQSRHHLGRQAVHQEGYIAAPLGSISLSAPNGRVYLGSGSTTTVAAGNAPLLYGVIQMGTDVNSLGNNIWAIPNKANPGYYTQVQNVPTQLRAPLTGNEVIVGQGATLDISGGTGSIFASRFLPSYSGSYNPLAGSYVIVPDGSVTLPGRPSTSPVWQASLRAPIHSSPPRGTTKQTATGTPPSGHTCRERSFLSRTSTELCRRTRRPLPPTATLSSVDTRLTWARVYARRRSRRTR